jgi:hypothetical protein
MSIGDNVSHGSGPTGSLADWLVIDAGLADHEAAFRAHYGPGADQNMDLVTLNLRLQDMGEEYAVVLAAPTVVDAPYVGQEGGVLTCTMGNWNGEPMAYGYQWQSDGADTGTGAASYTVTEADVGKTFTCTVTARNAGGSASSTSNEVVVTAPAE